MLFFSVTAPFAVAVLVLFREVLAPFALALVLAYVLAPVVAWMESRRVAGRGLPRWVAVVVLYTALIGILATGLAFGAPRIAAEVARLAREAPETIHTVQDEWLPRIETALDQASAQLDAPQPDASAEAPSSAERPSSVRVVPLAGGGYDIELPPDGIEVRQVDEGSYRVVPASDGDGEGSDLSRALIDSMQRWFRDTEAYAGTVVRSVQAVVAQVVGGVFRFFIMLMLSAYMLITSDRILGFFRSLARPSQRDRFDALTARIDQGLAGVVRGQLLIALVNGVLSGVGFWAAGLKYWPVLTLIATVLSLIPIFGAIISSVPAVLIGLQDSVGTALFVLAWIVGIHQLEANLLNPKIMGDAAKVHPVLVVFALLAGEHAFGILGALLAVPLLSISQSFFLHFREVALGVPRDPALAAQWADASLDPDGV
ncbi:MAG: AI-2E family transporter [Sandaracinaceae bacterium]